MKFRKKPVVVLAVQFLEKELGKAEEFCAEGRVILFDSSIRFAVYTLEGTMFADSGDWIIKGVNGEFSICKPDIFAETYEAVE